MTRNTRPSEQSSQTQRSDLLRLNVPEEIALRKIFDPRRLDASRIDRPMNLLQQQINRVIIGLKPRQRPVQAINRPRVGIYTGLKVIGDQKQTKGYRTVCQRRSERRESLFAMGIAGSGRRRSPGQGGSYKRTEGSQIICKKVRR